MNISEVVFAILALQLEVVAIPMYVHFNLTCQFLWAYLTDSALGPVGTKSLLDADVNFQGSPTVVCPTSYLLRCTGITVRTNESNHLQHLALHTIFSVDVSIINAFSHLPPHPSRTHIPPPSNPASLPRSRSNVFTITRASQSLARTRSSLCSQLRELHWHHSVKTPYTGIRRPRKQP